MVYSKCISVCSCVWFLSKWDVVSLLCMFVIGLLFCKSNKMETAKRQAEEAKQEVEMAKKEVATTKQEVQMADKKVEKVKQDIKKAEKKVEKAKKEGDVEGLQRAKKNVEHLEEDLIVAKKDLTVAKNYLDLQLQLLSSSAEVLCSIQSKYVQLANKGLWINICITSLLKSVLVPVPTLLPSTLPPSFTAYIQGCVHSRQYHLCCCV